MSVKIEQPYPVFRDKIGLPLDGGLIYIGVAGLNPETNPIQCYFDDDFTLVSPQPLRTINGYISRNGSPANIFLKVSECSITIKDRFRTTQYTNLNFQLSNFGSLIASQIIDESGLTQQQINNGVGSVSEMLLIPSPTDKTTIYVKSYYLGLGKGGGVFSYDSTKSSINDGGNVINGWVRQVPSNYLNAYNFGATGEGLQDYTDQDATQRINAIIANSTETSFVIHFTFGNYTLGRQTFMAGVGFTRENGVNVNFNSMTEKYIILQSDGANFKLRDGMDYGVFDKNTKAVFNTTMPFYPSTPSWTADGDKVAIGETGYMFNFNNIKGLTTSGSFNIDGNMINTNIGGQYGDHGWQLIAYGFRVAKVENFNIGNITTRNHCLDGMYIAGMNSSSSPDVPNPNYKGSVYNVVSTGNGRQGCSFAGGQNVSWRDCSFSDTALPSFKVRSMPMSCFDIEAEVNPIRSARFYNCFFGHAPTTSLVIESYDSRDIHFYSCRFINKYGVTAWANKPQIKFFNCYFNGYMEGFHNSSIPENRTVFESCTFTDNPDVNPDYTDSGRYLLNASNANPIFNNCTIALYKSGLPASIGISGLYTEYNNFTMDIYGTNRESAMAGIVTAKIRDYRASKTAWNPTIYATTDSVIVIENLSGQPNTINPFGVDGAIKVSTAILPSLNAYTKIGAAVVKATGTDDTATKLNSLIDSLKNSGYLK